MKIDIIAGARPNFMKVAPLLKQLKKTNIAVRLVHTGQHFDQKMSGLFFEELEIPEPDVNLNAGGGSHAEQTGQIMVAYEKLLGGSMTDLCLVVGDVNSTMACAIVAKKMNVKVGHIEAGIRSYDLTMPEEINRMVTDAITDYFYTTSTTAGENLQKAGIGTERIFFVGNTMIDTLLTNIPKLKRPDFYEALGLEDGKYFVLTLHRPGNVDNPESLRAYIQYIQEATKDYPVVFPVHPRTLKNLQNLKVEMKNIRMVEPQGYLNFNFLVKNAMGVITDSGGITEETTVMGVPCITMRDNTERPETVTIGSNEIIGTDPSKIKPYISKIIAGEWKKGAIPPLWDGKAAERIVEHLVGLVE